MNLTELNSHANTLDAEGMIAEHSLTEAAGAEEIVGKVCGIYQKVRPFLEAVGNLFFVPKKWRQAILTFVSVLDGLCPQSEI
jgi:hypothetical protein